MKTSEKDLAFLDRLPSEIKPYQSSNIKDITRHFKETSIISRMLMKDPGTFEMLEIVYTRKNLKEKVDKYLLGSLSTQALRDRLTSIVSYLVPQIEKIITRNGNIMIINLGSGVARDTICALNGNSHLANSVSVDCIDINAKALATARQLVKARGLDKSFRFIQTNLVQLPYKKEADLGLLIGVLCGLEHRTCVVILRKIKRYFKKGGILIVSNVLETMLERDSVFASVLKNIIGWKLIYKTPQELREIFEEAGYEWKDVFYDEPTRFHAMGVGMIPFT